ncbi:hypothetical protein MLD38_004864 [Melastoma candidum]|uniref:Uncharacterized protein n=1 Tax=Melastoma candidum TaxID=119954 RepID=A0ACB9S724_9MYRT|nr:hypothetical protein MLD38_004864 [Melastoma candidum]
MGMTTYPAKQAWITPLISSTSLLLLFLLLVVAEAALADHPQVRNYDFVLREKNFTKLCSTKSVLTVNDRFPGPTLYVKKGDTIFVNVHNLGSYGLTIHWHGVKQPRNPWFDGTKYITQCDISPGTNFTYQVTFSTEEGTVWWHAHSEWTRWSVHGAIVVSPADGTTYPFPKPDDEKVIVISSWYKKDVRESIAESLEEGRDLTESDAYAFNGEPGDFCPCSNETTRRWEVESGKTYLLHLVSAVMNAELYFAIANHTFTVVGSDGAYLKPFSTEILVISPGQTFDLLLRADQSPDYNYYMAARQYYNSKFSFDGYDHSNLTAIIQYGDDASSSALGLPVFPSNLPLYKEYEPAVDFVKRLRSLVTKEHTIDVPKNVTTQMFITASISQFTLMEEDENMTYPAASVNNISWWDPWTDVLQAYYKNISGFYTPDFPDYPPAVFNFTQENLPGAMGNTKRGTRVKVLEYNEEVEIVFQGTDLLNSSMDHPMHLHGHSFYVVGIGHGIYNNVTDPATFNLVDPPFQNTASVPKDGWLAIRFRADNPGVWLWHCHLDKHYTWGMNSVFIVKNGDTDETSIKDPPPYMPQCHQDNAYPGIHPASGLLVFGALSFESLDPYHSLCALSQEGILSVIVFYPS